jgi:hypothetical protein
VKEFMDLYISEHLMQLEIIEQFLIELGVLLSTLPHDCAQAKVALEPSSFYA